MTDGNAGLSRRGFLTAAGTAVAAAGTAAAQEDGNTTAGNETTTASGNQTMSGNETASGNESAGGNESSGGSGGSSGGVEKTVVTGPDGELVFDPETVEVTPGSTVTWVWESDNHNVVPESIPEGASWEGTGGDSETFDTGYEYSHTFETLGTYEYVCVPHASVGMVGAVEVVEELSSSGGEGGGGSNVPQVPDSAKSLGVATTFSMLSVLGLAYFFMKYGGDYETPEN